MLPANERTVVLNFLTDCLESAAETAAKFSRLKRIMSDKTVDGSYRYWSNVVKALKWAWYLAGGDNAGCQAIIDRAERRCNEQYKSV